MIKARLRQGDSQDHIKDLLRVPGIEDHELVPTNNAHQSSTNPLSSNEIIPQEEAPIPSFSNDPANVMTTWDTSGMQLAYSPPLVAPYTYGSSANYSTNLEAQTFLPQPSPQDDIDFVPSFAPGLLSPIVQPNGIWAQNAVHDNAMFQVARSSSNYDFYNTLGGCGSQNGLHGATNRYGISFAFYLT